MVSAVDCYQIPAACFSSSRKNTVPSASQSQNSSIMSSSIHQIATFVLIAMICLSFTYQPVESAIIRERRATSQDSTATTPEKECLTNTPCGWAVYTPFTRKMDYYMKNTCKCPADKTCLKTDDNLAASAYVYRCRPPTTATTTEQDTV